MSKLAPDLLAIQTRQTLLSRLKDCGDNESWKVFFDTYWKVIYRAAMNAGLSDAEAQEVVQDTVLNVSEKMPDFRYDPAAGSFKGWLFQIIRRRIADQVRKRARFNSLGDLKRTGLGRDSVLEEIPNPAGLDLETAWDREWDENLIDAAIQQVKTRVDPKQYQIFDLYVLKKWPAAKVSRALRISLARVYVAKYRVSKLIKRQIRKIEPLALFEYEKWNP